ncbi:MAG: amidohydrolase [Clostridia bacterium]|nr:amidohydrolase [Clostridia bacterium]
MKKIDVHVHYYPPQYLQQLEKMKTQFNILTNETGQRILYDQGSRIVTLTESMENLEERITEINRIAPGVIQALSLSIPNVHIEDKIAAVALSQLANDNYVDLRAKYPDYFLCLGSVPLPHVDAAVQELERALMTLKMNGIVIGTNICGEYLDAEKWAPFFTKANELRATILLHPMSPFGVDTMQQYGLAPLVGFVFDTTITVARMIFSGFFQRYADIKFIIPHLGGTVPYLMGRWDIGWRAYPESRKNIPHPPSYYIKQFYYDAVSLNLPAMKCAYEIAGPDRILFGTDYPHVIGDTQQVISCIQDMPISAEHKELIFSGNAKKILNNMG